MGLQSLSQLEARYGRANAQTILTNCATKMALAGLDVETAEYFSRSLGPATVTDPRRSRTRPWLSVFPRTLHDTTQEHGRPLLTPDEVRRLPQDEMLVLTGNRLPMRVTKCRYDRAPRPATAPGLGEALAITLEQPAPRSRSSSEQLPLFPTGLLEPGS